MIGDDRIVVPVGHGLWWVHPKSGKISFVVVVNGVVVVGLHIGSVLQSIPRAHDKQVSTQQQYPEGHGPCVLQSKSGITSVGKCHVVVVVSFEIYP